MDIHASRYLLANFSDLDGNNIKFTASKVSYEWELDAVHVMHYSTGHIQYGCSIGVYWEAKQ